MKRNTLSTSYANNYNSNKNQMVMKEFLDCNNSHNGEDDHYMNGFPWPPRSYTCSFCRKEFKSAQALGGHMNVHRRDRARLRQSSPPPTPNSDHNHHGHAHGQGHPMLNLNLNPNFSSSTSSNNLSFLPPSWSSSHFSTHKPHVTSTLPLLVSPTTTTTTPSSSYSSPSSASPSELKRWVVVDGILLKNPLTTKTSEATKSKIGEDGCKILKKSEILRMDLEIGLPREYDLDLELRLGN
ncbi:hypothetical protein TanjilG_02219 [Lupinus angustifolius]|uniref:C2H2-type domain-containing protein n=1 Tax=Lupinus angustifolius TaxID=3871 RepID=A0A4P1QQC5_LUPAN|nr:PREDICTED: transcriptional regulator SUPERMAN-like [Lupinus angustifolius]OIV92456.1 hypothetical protein TanjilG_02219 [Lupinus angustifolius]